MKDVSVTLIPLRHTAHHDKIEGGGGSGDSKKVGTITFYCCIETDVREMQMEMLESIEFRISMLLAVRPR